MAIVIALCSCPTADTATALANGAVERRLAACVNILPAVASVYRWEGRIVSETESTLLIKTTRECVPALKAYIEEFHPYDTPELIVLDVTDGLPAYLAWVAAESKPPSSDPM
ncbi:divalent-cation tolerance protein CutA [Pinirhizobacter soli]|uniref:divalent-cation tolerance protein CutA n=1 Tax=Pinirhizobacter soli TaxID=2786953 RepID=UPI002029E146|nr:divalent-cation tolerance protein CutA [Pinirhizobacter soli]